MVHHEDHLASNFPLSARSELWVIQRKVLVRLPLAVSNNNGGSDAEFSRRPLSPMLSLGLTINHVVQS